MNTNTSPDIRLTSRAPARGRTRLGLSSSALIGGLLGAALGTLVGACGAAPSGAEAPGAAATVAPVEGSAPRTAETSAAETAAAPSWTTVYNQVVKQGCGCHLTRAPGGLSLATRAGAYASLVGASAAGGDCASSPLKRVVPGHPERSLLYLKLNASTVPCGEVMPAGGEDPLSDVQIELVRAWIAAGALDN